MSETCCRAKRTTARIVCIFLSCHVTRFASQRQINTPRSTALTTRRGAARETRPCSTTMSAFFAAIFLLGLCVANAFNFTTVYEWDKFDFIWPSEADSSNGQMEQNFNRDNVEPHYMAVFGERLFLSLNMDNPGIPASLAWLPTNDTSTAPPKLAPFPSWNLHKKDDCDTIQTARGIETDAEGRLWLLDNGSSVCRSKLWIFDLLNNDTTERIHHFPDTVVSHSHRNRSLYDIVLDKTPSDDYLAYIVDFRSEHVIVYSRRLDKSWSVKTPGRKWFSLALSPKREVGELYLGSYGDKELYSVSVSELNNEGGSAAAKYVGKWSQFLYRMLFDSANNFLYAAFFDQNYLSKWNISEPFHEQRFHEVEGQGATVPFTFALDTTGNLWIMEQYVTGTRNRHHKLLKAAVGARSYQFIPSTGLPSPQAYVSGEKTSDAERSTQMPTIVIGLLVLCGTCLCVVNLVRMRRMQTSLRHISKENHELLPCSG